MTKTTKMLTSKVPQFKTYEEEARFWETHSFADYQDEMKPVKVSFARNLLYKLDVRFDKETLDKLDSQASKKGIGPSTLVREIVMEHLSSK